MNRNSLDPELEMLAQANDENRCTQVLRGWGLDRIGLHVAVLVGFAVLFVGLAIVGLKRSRA